MVEIEKMPFIRLLKTRLGYYFFDVNLNELVEVSEKTYGFLLKLTSSIEKNNHLVPTKDVIDEINSLKDKGYLSEKRPSFIEVPFIDYLEYFLSYRLNFLILQVTQKCNYRCSYCHFACDDWGYHEHNSSCMSWEIAQRSIDFLALRSRDTPDISIVFYGGEPLLEYELIHKCIEYSKKVFGGKQINFFITTNGELLSLNIAEYFSKNNVDLTISLDGPQEINDKNRKRAGDGSGTFNKVYENIMIIKANLPGYFKSIHFNSVLDPSCDCNKIDTFFSNNIFDINKVTIGLPSPVDKKKLSYSNVYLKNNKYNQLMSMLGRVGLLDTSDMKPIAHNYLTDYIRFENRFNGINKLPDKTGHAGPCIPGRDKLFVSTKGKFFICEKVRDDSEDLCIGSIEEGFDFNKIRKMCEYMCRDKCKNCWNILHCNICQSKVTDGEGFSYRLFDEECKKSRKITEENLIKMLAVREMEEMRNLLI